MHIVKVFEIPSTHFCTSLMQVPIVKYAKKRTINFFLLFAIEMKVLSAFMKKKVLRN
jgi:hypothetical protein